MTALRQKMIEDIQLAGMGERTQECYVRSVRQLSEYYGKSPDQIGEEEIRSYFLHGKNEKKWARPTCTIAVKSESVCKFMSPLEDGLYRSLV